MGRISAQEVDEKYREVISGYQLYDYQKLQMTKYRLSKMVVEIQE